MTRHIDHVVDRATVYRYIVRYMVDNQRPPTVRDIAADLDISSTSLVSRALDDLELQGRIGIERQRAGGIRLARPPRCPHCGGIDYAALLAELEQQERAA